MHLPTIWDILHWLISVSFCSFGVCQYICVLYRYCHSYYSWLYITGLSGSLDSEQQQESELFAYADHVVYPSDVGKHSGTYTCHGSVVRFCRLPLGEGALIFGMIYNFIPFMIYPIYNTLQKMDRSYIEAAQDLGANSFQVFWKVIFPLSMPGVVSGIMMVFMPTISTFAIAELLTMNNIKLFGTTIQENINNSLWNYGAALSLIMLFLIAATSLFTPENKDESERGGGVW